MEKINKFVETVNFKGLIMVGALLIGTLITGIVFAMAVTDTSVEREINAIHSSLTEIDKSLYQANVKMGVLVEEKNEVQTKIDLVANHIKVQGDKYKELTNQLNKITGSQKSVF
jgi:peptidoglycan hydrolase CwlO-like protein